MIPLHLNLEDAATMLSKFKRKYFFFLLFLLHQRDFSRFSESFDHVIRCWDTWSLSIFTLCSIFQIFVHNLQMRYFADWCTSACLYCYATLKMLFVHQSDQSNTELLLTVALTLSYKSTLNYFTHPHIKWWFYSYKSIESNKQATIFLCLSSLITLPRHDIIKIDQSPVNFIITAELWCPQPSSLLAQSCEVIFAYSKDIKTTGSTMQTVWGNFR